MILRKPIFENRWYQGKRPTLRIGILRLIVSIGQISKKKATYELRANYADISDAMEALKKRDFVKYSENKSSGRNPEKFYKITENGLKALLSVNKLSPQEFWKVATLLCISRKEQGIESQFIDHYNHFENDFLGISVRRHLLPSWFYDDILRLWLEVNNKEVSTNTFCSTLPLPQLVIECLAFNGSMNLKQLVEKTSAKEEDIVQVLNNYSIKPHESLEFNLQSQDKTDIRKKIYDDFTSHILIDANDAKTQITYELSIFGVMLAIALIRYYHTSMDKTLSSIKSFEDCHNVHLTYKGKKMEEYYDKIACNYGEKLPLIFKKWSLLRSHLGSLLYHNFDFLIYDKARSNIRHTSVLFGGNKEFYEEVQSMAQNTHAYEKLYVIYTVGKEILEKYQQYEDRTLPIRRKIIEISGELFVTHVLSSLGEKVTNKTQHFDVSRESIKKIEEIFVEEVSFFFYLNLNTKVAHANDNLSSNQGLFSKDLDLQDLKHNKVRYMMNEMMWLGSPKQRLMAVLSKDNAIKEWFSKQMEDILSYRDQISEKMSEFSNEIAKPKKYRRRQETRIQELNKKPSQLEFTYEEYDITKICSDKQLPYVY